MAAREGHVPGPRITGFFGATDEQQIRHRFTPSLPFAKDQCHCGLAGAVVHLGLARPKARHARLDVLEFHHVWYCLENPA
jgi:hypothetical protein